MATDFLAQVRLDGRGLVVLGAGQGIGKATAHALAQAGGRVLCVDREADLAKKVAQDVGGVACVADVTSREDVERIFATAKEAFGGVRGVVDIVGMAKLLPLSKFTDADYEWQFDIGVRHALLALQIGAPIVASLASEDLFKDIDFSSGGIRHRWEAGASDALQMIQRAPWNDPVDPLEGVFVHELSARTESAVRET